MLIVVAFKNAKLEMPTSPLCLGVTRHVQLGQEALLPVLGAVLVYPPSFNFLAWTVRSFGSGMPQTSWERKGILG